MQKIKFKNFNWTQVTMFPIASIAVLVFMVMFLIAKNGWAQNSRPVQRQIQLALLKYQGGGDWYANLETSLPNLIAYCNQNCNMHIATDQAIVDVGSNELFNYPFLHLTGHGNVNFNDAEVLNLRNYLLAGGFLHVSDNYGIDKFIRAQMKKVFPDAEFIEIPFTHPIFHQKFHFNNGLPKIHEHDGKSPQAFGLFVKGRMVCFYDYECDLGDGWESFEVHKDPPALHLQALQMGANILTYVFLGNNGISNSNTQP